MGRIPLTVVFTLVDDGIGYTRSIVTQVDIRDCGQQPLVILLSTIFVDILMGEEIPGFPRSLMGEAAVCMMTVLSVSADRKSVV